MITIQNRIELEHTYPLERLGELHTLLFFDIETTGFSGDYSNLYLIGCTYYQEESWYLIQWFADSLDSEPQLLKSFFEFMKGFSVLIHFNGDGFDIPYLKKRCYHLELNYNFDEVQSIDIYKRIKPYRNLLGLESMKQKAIEQFLGIRRKDLCSGGQLIEVYKDYLISKNRFLYDMLILHNEDDLKGMPLILPILNYPDFLEHEFTLIRHKVSVMTDLFGAQHRELELVCESDYQIPRSFEQQRLIAFCKAEENRLTISIPLYDGELKYYYPDFKDYYYLIYEDTAVHKSVGEYVDKAVKKKAIASTCYTRRSGCFLPQLQRLWEPALRIDYKDKISYVEFHEGLLSERDQLIAYVRLWLEYFGKKDTDRMRSPIAAGYVRM